MMRELPVGRGVELLSGVEPDFRLHPAGHAFFNDERPSYHAESAASAWQSTLGFLHQRLD
ncbi:dienelactone hydrolase family protein [Streptomyces asiaticus]